MDTNEPIVFLERDELYLRPIETADARRMQRWINNPVTRRYMGSVFPINQRVEEAWIDGMYKDRTDVTLAIVLKERNRHIGSVGLHGINFRNGCATTGMLVGEPDARGNGYGPMAKDLLLDYAFNTLGLRTVRSATLACNPASARSLQKNGYREAGRWPDGFFREGAWHDEVLWVVTRDTWQRV